MRMLTVLLGLFFHLSLIAGPPVGGGGGGPWQQACLDQIEASFPGLSYSCPSGYEQDNSTCGCSPIGSSVCAICEGVTCQEGYACEMPAGCQSLVCVESISATSTNNLTYDPAQGIVTAGGLLVCAITPGASASGLPFWTWFQGTACQKMAKDLTRFKVFYNLDTTFSITNGSLIPASTFDQSKIDLVGTINPYTYTGPGCGFPLGGSTTGGAPAL